MLKHITSPRLLYSTGSRHHGGLQIIAKPFLRGKKATSDNLVIGYELCSWNYQYKNLCWLYKVLLSNSRRKEQETELGRWGEKGRETKVYNFHFDFELLIEAYSSCLLHLSFSNKPMQLILNSCSLLVAPVNSTLPLSPPNVSDYVGFAEMGLFTLQIMNSTPWSCVVHGIHAFSGKHWLLWFVWESSSSPLFRLIQVIFQKSYSYMRKNGRLALNYLCPPDGGFKDAASNAELTGSSEF